jgi:hypothetical protein
LLFDLAKLLRSIALHDHRIPARFP